MSGKYLVSFLIQRSIPGASFIKNQRNISTSGGSSVLCAKLSKTSSTTPSPGSPASAVANTSEFPTSSVSEGRFLGIPQLRKSETHSAGLILEDEIQHVAGKSTLQKRIKTQELFKDFKYSLQISEPFIREKDNLLQDNRFILTKSEDQPLVILFGWAGASEKNLRKYAKIYQDAGCNTLSYVLPSRFIFLKTVQVPYLMERLVETIIKERLERSPTFFHNMSDTGNMCYQGINKSLGDMHQELQVRGAIYDSCPGPRPKATFSRLWALTIVNWIVCHKDGLNFLEKLQSTRNIFTDRFLPNVPRRLRGEPALLSEIDGTWAGDYVRDEAGKTHPELFLYSNSDFYLPQKYLEKEVLERRRGRNERELFVKKFQKSPHVGHLRRYKADYTDAIHDFLHRIYFSRLSR